MRSVPILATRLCQLHDYKRYDFGIISASAEEALPSYLEELECRRLNPCALEPISLPAAPAQRLYLSRDQKGAGGDEAEEYLPRITLQQPVRVVCLGQR